MLAILFEEQAECSKKMLCSPTKMKNRGISINNFKLGADISIFLVIGAEKNSKWDQDMLPHSFT